MVRLTGVLGPLVLSVSLLAACGGGDDEDNGTVMPIGPAGPVVEPAPLNGDFELTVIDGVDSSLVDALDEFLGQGVDYVNRLVALPKDIPVSLQNCGVANAFYLPERIEEPSGPAVFLCWEFFFFAVGVFDELFPEDPEAAAAFSLGAITYVMYHEFGHALDDQLDLPIFGNTESAADAIATVLAVEQGFSFYAVAGALLFDLDGQGSFVDEHAGGADRAGDLFCWAIGGDPFLAEALSTITQSFSDGGRDCVTAYAGQLAAVSTWLPEIAGPVGKRKTGSATSELSETALESLRNAILASKAVTRLETDKGL